MATCLSHRRGLFYNYYNAAAAAAAAAVRLYSKYSPPPPAPAFPLIKVSSNNVAYLKMEGRAEPKPRQLLSLPPFPSHPLPGKNYATASSRVTAISWVTYYLHEVPGSVISDHFIKGLVQMECTHSDGPVVENDGLLKPMRKIRANEVMKEGARVHVPVSIAESRISKRFDVIPRGTLYPNADEIAYLQRQVKYKDSAILVLNKPPRMPVQGSLPVHNSMDVLAAAALTYGSKEAPKLVHRLDRESSGLILFGRTEKCVARLQWLFSGVNITNSSHKDGGDKGGIPLEGWKLPECYSTSSFYTQKSQCNGSQHAWNDACEATYQRYWALVIGCPKEKEGLISAPLSKVLLNDGRTERVILAHPSGLEPSQKAVTEYRVLGPTINGCSWIELRPHTRRKHQLRVHCAEALGTPVVGDYIYGWFVHKRWKHIPQQDIEPISGKPYKLRRPKGLDVQKGSVLSKVPLLHLHCRELVLPNMAKFLDVLDQKSESGVEELSSQPDLLRFVSPMSPHMRISWNLMSSYLV